MYVPPEPSPRTTVRPPAVAGMFYPADPGQLRDMVRKFLVEGQAHIAQRAPAAINPKALIAPHAGFVYSGPTAGVAYASVIPRRGKIRRVILLGPSHRVAFQGIATHDADGFVTPLGLVPLDQGAIRKALALPFVGIHPAAHAPEHSLETHLPFIQEALGAVCIVPLLFGHCAPQHVAALLDLLWLGDETLIAVSSDLSHYHAYDDARQLDRQTSDAIEQLRPDPITPDRACGSTAIQGLILQATQRTLAATTLDLRNSGDTAGPRQQVVGYGAYVFH